MPHKTPTQLQGITDLTLFADIKPGLIEGIFDSRSYAWRLQRVLTLLDAARHASRESDLLPSPFIDGVGRLRGIHFFRFAVMPDSRQLFLNVTFDGGWEPYMRLIWGPLGKLLDLVFCHCEGYPLSATSSYEDYIRWVRQQEVPSQFFYADSGGTVADRVYLNRLEARLGADRAQAGADLRAAQLALDAIRPPEPGLDAATAAIRALKGVYGLMPFFGAPASPDGAVLLRFAQDSLADLRNWIAQGLFDPGQRFDLLRPGFEPELAWLMNERWKPPVKRDPGALDKSKLQAGILKSLKAKDGRYARGALVLARVTDADGARKWLKRASAPEESRPSSRLVSDASLVELPSDGTVACTVAITFPGLRALGVPEPELDLLPGEFIDGMEARAGILGDVRINHPRQWRRPLANWGNGTKTRAPIDLSLVHLVLQLRTCELDGEQESDRSRLLPRLVEWLIANLPPADGIELMAVEPAWSKPATNGEPAARDHFGYVDGVSQPGLEASASKLFWDDAVKMGEVLLGWTNDRGDGPQADRAPSSPWLDLGTFLVVRKIGQYPDRFDAIVDKAAHALLADGVETSLGQARELVRSKLMGRTSNGTPLITQRVANTNDFNYRLDPDGAECPFASHVRRANPRVATVTGAPPPRIMRRGMSYGSAVPAKPESQGTGQAEHGVFFMACNASIAEQFEVIQRWMAGANSSGVSSSHSDPFVGVPRIGEPTVFRFTHRDKVIRVDLGDQPVCRLEWGLYAFMPSLDLLQKLEEWVGSAGRAPAAAASTARAAPPEAPKEPSVTDRVKADFEDENLRGGSWKDVRDRGGAKRFGRNVMVGSFDEVVKVLRDKGETYSARGYGERMKETLGPSPFGQDDQGADIGHADSFVDAVKNAIGKAVTEQQAYDTAYRFIAGHLRALATNSQAIGLPIATVDTIDLGNKLIAHLLEQWFGVVPQQGVIEPGGLAGPPTPVRYPGHFLSLARNIFSAHPNRTALALAMAHGAALKAQVPTWMKAGGKAPVMSEVLKAMEGHVSDDYLRNGIVANVMLGLPATLLGTWGKVLRTWSTDRSLWRLQHELARMSGSDPDPDHAQASEALRESLIDTMATDPVADGIWRTVKQEAELGQIKVSADDVVWLGLGSALDGRRDNAAEVEDMLFGGSRDAKSPRLAPHACPGRGLAIGALLGGLAALLQAGELARTPSPTTLTLKPPRA